MLGKIIAQDVNLLFLDEPTNHLDIDSIEALTNAIKAFEGSCIIVTHSEELLRAVCDRLIVFTNDGADYFNGTYDEFLEKIGWDDDTTTEKKPVAKPKVNKKESKRLRAAIVAQKSKETAPIKKEISELEALIPTLKATEKSQKESQLLELQLKLEKMNAEFEKRMKEV